MLTCNLLVLSRNTNIKLLYLLIKGGAILTPETGSVINGKCVTTRELPSDDVHLQLEVC